MPLSRKVLQASHNQLQLGMQRRFILELLDLFFEGCEALTESGNAGFKFLLVNEPLGITVDQPGETLPQLPDLGVECGLLRPLGPARGVQAAAICVCEALRMSEQGTHFLPYRQVQALGAALRIVPDPLAPKAIGIGAETAIIGIRPGVAFGGFTTDRLPVQGIATVVALHSPLQQVPRTTARLARVALVLLELGLDRSQQVRLHQRRDRHRKPLFGGHIPDGDGTPGLERPVARRP